MNAKEMFDKLGWKIDLEETYGDTLVYSQKFLLATGSISFDLTMKEVYLDDDKPKENYSKYFDVLLHLAIHQQMKELGWIDET